MVVATTLAYPLTDLLLIGVIVGALAATGWRLDRTWVTLGAGIGVFWVADSFYLVESVTGTLSSPSWYDIGWSLGLLLVAFASWQPAVVRRPAVPDGLRFISRAARVRRGRPGDADLRLPDRHEPGRGRRCARCRWSRSWRG